MTAVLILAAAVGLAVPARTMAATTPAPASSGLFTYSDPQIDESSGIAASSFDDTFYTHNDSGDSARFFRVDARGDTVSVYTLRGATNVDWEDMATGTDSAGNPVLFFGDIGDNDHIRKEIAVYEVPEPRGPSADVVWTRYRFSYPDGAHDAEALLVNPRSHRIYIATKELLNNGRLYEAPATLSKTTVNVLTPVGAVPPLTTSADFAPDGSRVVLLTYLGAFWADDVGAVWHRFDVPLPRQAEAISYTHDGSSVLIGGEGAHSVVYRAAAATAEVESSQSPQPSLSTTPTFVPSSSAPSATSTPGAHRSSGPPAGAVILVLVVAVAVAGVLIVRRRRNP